MDITERALRVLVVEDEPLARDALVRSLRCIGWIDVVGEAGDGPAASREIARLHPDLLLMDIKLPGYDGLEVLERLERPPAVIFVTAHDQHAVTAFDLAAVDYLLKPFDAERLLTALERGRETVNARHDPDATAVARVRRALDTDRPVETLFVRDRGVIIAIPAAEVIRFEADDIYVGVHARGRRFLVRTALGDLERRLDARTFLRVHRGHLVNLRAVIRFVPVDGGRFRVELSDGSRMIASRRHSRAIRELGL